MSHGIHRHDLLVWLFWPPVQSVPGADREDSVAAATRQAAATGNFARGANSMAICLAPDAAAHGLLAAWITAGR